jgi:hypothetical protein
MTHDLTTPHQFSWGILPPGMTKPLLVVFPLCWPFPCGSAEKVMIMRPILVFLLLAGLASAQVTYTCTNLSTAATSGLWPCGTWDPVGSYSPVAGYIPSSTTSTTGSTLHGTGPYPWNGSSILGTLASDSQLEINLDLSAGSSQMSGADVTQGEVYIFVGIGPASSCPSPWYITWGTWCTGNPIWEFEVPQVGYLGGNPVSLWSTYVAGGLTLRNIRLVTDGGTAGFFTPYVGNSYDVEFLVFVPPFTGSTWNGFITAKTTTTVASG